MKFNRSEFMRQRHELAREQRNFFERTTGEKVSYSEFLKENNPVSSNIVVYDVSYQVNYRGNQDNFVIPNTTFKVIAFENQYSEIYNKTMNMILDSKGAKTGNNLSVGTIEMLKDNTDIKVTPRGMERSSRGITREETLKLLNTGYVVSELDKNVKFKNKKGREGELKFDLRHM